MPAYSTEDLCNVAFLGHAGTGKTTLTERLLHECGVIPTPGTVEQGNTTSDHDPLEKTYGHSVESAVVHFDHAGRHFNVIDTPGYPDFLGRALSALPAVETAAIVVNAQTGIERVTRRAMEEATERGLCRMVIVNRIDLAEDLPGVLDRIQSAFGRECLPINLPAGGATRVVDCFFNPAGEADFLGVEAAHRALVDQVVEVDEALMELYLEQGEISPEQLHEPFEQALRDGHLIPVCFVSARTGAGVPQLLEVLDRLMPTPLEGNPLPFLRSTPDGDQEIRPRPDPDAHVLAHVFQVYLDPFIGRVGIARVAQGTLRPEQALLVGDARKPVKLARIYRPQGRQLEEMDTAIPGDLVAVTKVNSLHHGAVLHDSHEDDFIRARPLRIPDPMVGLAVEPQRRGDEKKLSEALHDLPDEDPSIRVERSPATQETVIRGYGELHLRAVLDHIAQRHHVEVHAHRPKIAYRETITSRAEGHCRHKKQTGGAGQFGEVYLRVEPLERGRGFEFVSEVVGGAIPTSLIPAVEKGVREVLDRGVVSGHPLQDVRVIVYDGKHHSVDSKEVAFVIAGRKAFREAVANARPIILEPMVRIDVTAPEPAIGGITGDFSTRRGRICDTRALDNGMATITAEVPLAELEDYESQLKSLTGGEGSYTLEPLRYEPVPDAVKERIISLAKSESQDEAAE